jgi:hypothetical protein
MAAQDFLEDLPVIGGLFDDSEEQAERQMREILKLYEGLETPDLQFRSYRPEEYSYIGDMTPEAAKHETISEDPRLKSAQMSHLAKLAGLAEDGLSDVDEATFMQAQLNAGQQARGNREAAMQNAAARGVSGGGLEFAMMEAGNQAAAQQAQMAQLQQAAESARQRALYSQAYGQQLGAVRGQDMNANAANADIINRFNLANTQTRNDAQAQNLQNRQAVMNANTQGRNNAQQYNAETGRAVQQQNYENQLKKTAGMAGAHQGMANTYAAQGAANADTRNKYLDTGVKLFT